MNHHAPPFWNHADEYSYGDGRPGIVQFANAVMVWTACQNRESVSVALAANAFSVPAEMIRQAVRRHPELALLGDPRDPHHCIIEHEART